MQFPRIRSVFNFGFPPGSTRAMLANSAAMTAITVGLIFGGVTLGGAALLGLEGAAAATAAAGKAGAAIGAALIGAGALSAGYELAYLGASINDRVQANRTVRDAQEQVNHMRDNLYHEKVAQREFGAVPADVGVNAMADDSFESHRGHQPSTRVHAANLAVDDMVAAYTAEPAR